MHLIPDPLCLCWEIGEMSDRMNWFVERSRRLEDGNLREYSKELRQRSEKARERARLAFERADDAFRMAQYVTRGVRRVPSPPASPRPLSCSDSGAGRRSTLPLR